MSTFKSLLLIGGVIGIISFATTGCGSPDAGPTTPPGDTSSSANTTPTGVSADDPNDISVYHVKRDAEQKYKDNPGLPGWNEAARLTIEEKLGWDKLPDAPKSVSLPGDLTGVDFLGDDGSEIRCLASATGTILTPRDSAPVNTNYAMRTEQGRSVLDLQFEENGKACHTVYGAECSGRKVILSLLSATLPKLPSVLRGTLPR